MDIYDATETAYKNGYEKGSKETVEKCIQLLEDLRVPEDGRHEWRDHHNDCIDRCLVRFKKEFQIKG